MKIISWISGSAFVLIMLFCTTTPMTSCIKETIRDTLTIKDTITIKDTVTIPCECNGEEDLKRGLIAYYNFNNGTLNDSSGKNNHIVFNNAVQTTDRLGRPNNAYLFNGTDSYMKVANSSSLNPTEEITLMAIVKPNAFYTGPCYSNQILGKINTNSGDYNLGSYWLRFTHLSFDCGNGSDLDQQIFTGVYGDNASNMAPGVKASQHRIQQGQWYNVVYTYKKGVSSIYVNGQLIDQQIRSGPFTPSTYDIYIGKSGHEGYSYLFNGVIDEIRIYERALCEKEVEVLNGFTK